MSAKVVVSASLSSDYDKRYVAGRLYGQRSAKTKRLRAAVAAETASDHAA
jgi:hypothetical protein